ncbi:Parp14 [Symbiodinium natans]|uniref:Parp14 protein n=1 Tax=Symbiodinium natans TaxID=878477 RepID=A0A812KIK1_9DINO|nr:Parp14 [Symbiodinium natans]
MQMKFTAPHPLNLVAPHLMIDLRQAGYIEIYGPDTHGVYGFLHQWLEKNWKASIMPADAQFCDRKYRCKAFHKRGSEGENNMGLCAMHLVDFLSKGCHWKMIACNASNFGRLGDQREQQIVLRYDDFAHQDCDHLLVELRDVGYVEVSGIQNAPSAAAAMHEFFSHQWRCTEYRNSVFEVFNAKYCDRKYRTPPNFYFREGLWNNLGRRTLELATFMSSRGWELAACNGGSLTLPKQKQHNGLVREHQIKFVGAKRDGLATCPLLMVEFRSVPARDMKGRASHESFIEITGTDVDGVHGKLAAFVQGHMQSRLVARGTPSCDLCFVCDAFQMKEADLVRKEGRFLGESNFGKYAMRLCDFMVDYLGEWDLLVCNNNCVTVPVKGQTAVAREAQMFFRYRRTGRDVFLCDAQAARLGRPPKAAPNYWTPAARAGTTAQEVVPATDEELVMLQEVMDGTYKAVATRDRGGKPIASRFVVVQALRSENPWLWDRYAARREAVGVQLRSRSDGEECPVTPSTLSASLGLTLRCLHEVHGNPSNEAYLLHGSNPTSALSILRTSFKMGLAGKNAGSMFGPGVYLAESSVKADEYAQDDTNGSYTGLYAVLFCRAVVGRALQVTDPADYGPLVTSGDFESVVGDRERAVGTFREFVFFHEAAIYPEFAVFYRREMFRQSHILDDRIRKDFGALHSRAAAGELAGWAHHAETCLALVVILDQFSRSLYRNTPAAYACDAAARVAANAALARGDDKHHWPPGPKRWALYLPFMHSEDLQDKVKCVNLMREGMGKSLFGKGGSPSGRAGAGSKEALPKLQTANSTNGSMLTGKKLVSKSPSAAAAAAATPATGSKSPGPEEAAWADDDSDYSDDMVELGLKATTGGGRNAARERKAYSMQAALEISALPVLPLNHAHAQRFREMRLDAQTQQATYAASCEDQGAVAKLAWSSTAFHRLLWDEAAWRGSLLSLFFGGAAGALPFRGSWRCTLLCRHGGSCSPGGPGFSAGRLFARLRVELSQERLRLRRARGCKAPLRRMPWQSHHRPVRADQPCWLDARQQLGALFHGWPGAWKPGRLRRRFGRRHFAVTLPGAGQVFRMRLRDFLRYAAANADFLPPRWDAEPLYLFDPNPPMALRALRPPKLSALPDLARQCRGLAPSLQTVSRGWLLMGGAGSGSRFHTDAYGCGAWLSRSLSQT